MVTSSRKKKSSALKVVFDTNVLYTGSASDLFRQEVIELIKKHFNHQDLDLSWYLPEIVIHERQYQMLDRGNELLPSLKKMEALLGHNLNISKAIIEKRVQEVISTQLQENNVQLYKLAVDEVDWSRLILDSAYRRPPFEAGNKEKGFRDALVVETFLQIVATSPTTPKVCRVALVSNDKLLSTAVKDRTVDRSNVRLLTDIVQLESLINTLVAEISEDFVASIQALASVYFFSPNQENTLYYTEHISERILSQFANDLNALPENADRRKNGRWLISAPQFVKKDGQRVFWISQISTEATAYKDTLTGSFVASTILAPSYIAPLQPPQPPYIYEASLIGDLVLPSNNPPEIKLSDNWRPRLPVLKHERVVAKGKTIFEIKWSVLVSTNQKLSNPKIEEIVVVGTTWQ